MKDDSALDKALRRLGGILASPSLLLHYGSSTPALETAALRRLGLDKKEAADLLDLLCRQGRMDEGARTVLEEEALRRHCRPAEAARALLREDREA